MKPEVTSEPEVMFMGYLRVFQQNKGDIMPNYVLMMIFMLEHHQKKLKKNQIRFQMDQLYGENILNFHFYQINKSKISDYIFIVIQKRKNLEKIKELLISRIINIRKKNFQKNRWN